MSFLALIISLLLDQALRHLENLRGPRWFGAYYESLQFLAQNRNFWRAGTGLLVIVLVPTVATLFVGHFLDHIWGGFGFVYSVILLLLTLGPRDLHAQVDAYIEATQAGDQQRAASLAGDLLGATPPDDSAARSEAITHAVLMQANDRLFGIFFWFAILGPAGAVLYRSTDFLRRMPADDNRSQEFSDFLDRLYGLLAWVPAHLAALGYALAGGFEDAVSAMKNFYLNCSKRFFQVNNDVLVCAGLGALRVTDEEAGTGRLLSALLLVRRAVIIWLAVYALMTLFGWVW
ncbi:MAG: regulatory signaling modulator protein AmpE [Gammaproteobacteria bacterium]|nr:regulatory signaling modulator protein AmpE [Gammaproteobacteria bacterium]MDE2346267.1 regulatory signaling modulator protein AmpE [Gammaproteobacteria bacterium]